MVSIRRRKLLGLYPGKSSFTAPFSGLFDSGHAPEDHTQNSRPYSIHPMTDTDFGQLKEKAIPKVNTGSSNASTSSSSKEEHHEQFAAPEIKRRKRYRRKNFANQEPCVMRGVYFKNMKWQAAIKVDKKQIHLGTVSSQEEAARLYDRAAFMCGREPNFELSEEDKEELRKLKWDEFLAVTRSAISNKKQRRNGVSSRRKSETAQNSDWDGDGGGFSGSED